VLIEVHQPYVDVSARDLSLTLGAPAASALETLRVTIGGLRIELRLLGCSHQVLVAGDAVLSETVACVPGVAGSLPDRRTDGAYDFRAHVERLKPEAYAARARDVLARAAAGPHALAGVFAAAPGAGAAALPAFTALAARPLSPGGGIAWTTWHGYPQTGEIVVTASGLRHAT
jgi:hypothetical protein